MSITRAYSAWGIKWVSDNALDGRQEHLLGRYAGGGELPSKMEGHVTLAFRTRREAAAFIKEHYGYIARRPDLRREPHGWRVPRVVRIEVTVREGF